MSVNHYSDGTWYRSPSKAGGRERRRRSPETRTAGVHLDGTGVSKVDDSDHRQPAQRTDGSTLRLAPSRMSRAAASRHVVWDDRLDRRRRFRDRACITWVGIMRGDGTHFTVPDEPLGCLTQPRLDSSQDGRTRSQVNGQPSAGRASRGQPGRSGSAEA